MDYDYNIGDIIYNIWNNNFFVIIDYEYKNTSKFYTIRDLLTNRIITNAWLYSKRLKYVNGNFNGYETEFRLSSESEALSKYRKDKIKKFIE